jgi:hypothetical protein
MDTTAISSYDMQPKELRSRRFWPNGIVQNSRTEEAVIRSFLSEKSDDWAMNWHLLLYGFSLLAQQWEVTVELCDGDREHPTVLAVHSLTKFAVLLDEAPEQGSGPDRSPFYWVDRNGDYVLSRNSSMTTPVSNRYTGL